MPNSDDPAGSRQAETLRYIDDLARGACRSCVLYKFPHYLVGLVGNCIAVGNDLAEIFLDGRSVTAAGSYLSCMIGPQNTRQARGRELK